MLLKPMDISLLLTSGVSVLGRSILDNFNHKNIVRLTSQRQEETASSTLNDILEYPLMERQVALSDYEEKIRTIQMEQTTLENFLNSDASFTELEGYWSYIEQFEQQLDLYRERCDDAITSGKGHMRYLNPFSYEYGWIQANEGTLSNNIRIYADYYHQLVSDYDRHKAMITSYHSYLEKLSRVQSSLNELKDYSRSVELVSPRERWVSGLQAMWDAMVSACNDAITAGRAYQQYLDQESTIHKAIENMEKKLVNISMKARTIYGE